VTTSTSEQPGTRITYRSVIVLAALVLLPGLVYTATVVEPYVASDLDTLSLTDLAARAQPPTDPGPVSAGWVSLLGFYSLLLAPLGALLALGGSALQLLAAFPRSERRVPPGVAVGLAVVAVVSVVVLAWFLSPLGRALTSWTLD
jgi:hypothetical protein